MADPYLDLQPSFAYTLPIQLLLSGITLTLLVVLFIHLLFTTQYHYPLAPLNYCLQFASIIAVLLSLCVRIGVILHHAGNQADHWPYSLAYVAVPVPADNWNRAEDAAWYTLQAICNGLANFLTLLYPSRTEARLIFIALGPLAIASSGLYYCTLSSARHTIDMGDAVRSVFSCTLLVIFTLSLCIWGFFVNRHRAWRLDGGTAVFGLGALGLAFVTTASSFVAVREESIDWLQHLIWAAVLWQTWLGWWWWVGAGMGIGEVEDIIARTMRKRRRAARRAHRAEVIATNGAAGSQVARRQTSVAGMMKTGTSAVVGFTSSLAQMRPGSQPFAADDSAARPRRRPMPPRSQSAPPRDIEEGAENVIEMGSLRVREPVRPETDAGGSGSGSGSGGRGGIQSSNSNSETSSTSRTPSLHAPRSVGELFSFPATWLNVYLRRLRRAHEDAARRRAVEQAERRSRVPAMGGGGVAPPEDGWGLGAFGIREAEDSSWRLAERDRHLPTSLREDGAAPEDERAGTSEETAERPDGNSGTTAVEEQGMSPRSTHSRPRAADDDWEDVDASSDTSDDNEPTPGRRSRSHRSHSPPGSGTATPRAEDRQGWSWRGPLRQWRLQDRSRY